jgi:peroxiredoxin
VDQPAQARRVVKQNRLDFAILCDTDRSVINAFDLVQKGAGPGGTDIALPANILIDSTGKVVWEYRAKAITDRAHPNEVLRAVRTLRDR